MAISDLPSAEFITDLIQREIRSEVQKVVGALDKEITQMVQARLAKKADEMALRVLEFYDIQRAHDRVVITVNKAQERPS